MLIQKLKIIVLDEVDSVLYTKNKVEMTKNILIN